MVNILSSNIMRRTRMKTFFLECSPSQGFTLIEMIVTIAILAITLGIAVPSFNSIINNQRARNAATELQLTLMQARSEAIKRNIDVTVSPISSLDWSSGWKIVDPDDALKALREQKSFKNVTFTGTIPASIIYNRSGRISSSTALFEITANNASASKRCLLLDLSGRPTIKKSAC